MGGRTKNKRTIERTKERTYEKNEQIEAGTKLRRNIHTNEWKNERIDDGNKSRKNDRTKECTNERKTTELITERWLDE